MIKFGNTYLNFGGSYLNCNFPSALIYSNTAYDVTRTPIDNEDLTIDVVAPTANYDIFALKWQEHWSATEPNIYGSICYSSNYDMSIFINSNNYSMCERLGWRVPYTACPFWHSSSTNTFPGNIGDCSFTTQTIGTPYSMLSFLYKAESNSSFYTRKLIYNNNNNTISGYLNNTFMFQLTGLDTFTSFNSFTYSGDEAHPATAYVKDINLYAFSSVNDAINW